MISRAADSYILQASAFAYIVLLMSSAFTHACKRSGNTTHSIMHCTAACMLTSAHMTMKCTMVQLQAGALHSVVSVCHWLRTLSLVINFDSASLSSVAASKPTKGDACLFFYPACTLTACTTGSLQWSYMKGGRLVCCYVQQRFASCCLYKLQRSCAMHYATLQYLQQQCQSGHSKFVLNLIAITTCKGSVTCCSMHYYRIECSSAELQRVELLVMQCECSLIHLAGSAVLSTLLQCDRTASNNTYIRQQTRCSDRLAPCACMQALCDSLSVY
eukprot:14216-Heterococcus_DN1.PRE.1